jgi:hypothetical protein
MTRPFSISGEGIIEVFAWKTEPGYALHLLNYTNPNMTHGAIRRIYPLGRQQVRFRVQGSCNQGRALRLGDRVLFKQQGQTVSFDVPSVADYEVIALV